MNERVRLGPGLLTETVTRAEGMRTPMAASVAPDLTGDETAAVAGLADAYHRLRTEIAKVVIGQDDVVAELLTGLFARGHVLLIGVPGLAKTLLVSTVARILSLSFRRIQFTPDMMPSDITGTDILQDDPETGRRRFTFIAGPIFANMILADEINRTPPKTQAALLEAMQERHVTAGGSTYPLPDPFFVLATQNPIEQEGTYPLPEAQLDRFMLNVLVPYPSAAEELEILKRTTGDTVADPAIALSAEQILAAQHLVRRVPVPEHVFEYARDLVRASRPNEPKVSDLVRRCVSWGAGPRAGQSLILAAKTRAALHGRFAAGVADVRHVAKPVLRHRIVTTFHAEAEGINPDAIVDHLLEGTSAATERVVRAS
jgi:MoxR-like ATPase